MKDLPVEVRIYISTKAATDNIFLTRFYPVKPSLGISMVKWLLFNRLEIPVDLQIISSIKGVIPDDQDQVWQHAIQEDVWRQPSDGKGKVKVTQYTADYFIFIQNIARPSLSNICEDFEIPTLKEPFDLSSWDLQVPIKLHPSIASSSKNENRQHGDVLKELVIFDILVNNSTFNNKNVPQNTKTNQDDPDSINLDKDLITVRFSSSYVIPFMLPESGRFPCGSTTYDIKKYIAQCSRIDARFIDLCRKGENVSLEDGEKLQKYEVNFGIELEVMRKFDVQLHYRVNNTMELLQYTVRDGSTTIGGFLEEMKTSNDFSRGMFILLSIPGGEEMWSTTDLLNSINRQKLVLSIRKRNRCCCIL